MEAAWECKRVVESPSSWTWMWVFVVLASMLAICAYRYIAVWTPLQRFYFKTYIRSGLTPCDYFSKDGAV